MKKKLYLLLAFVVLGVLQSVIFMFAYSDRLAEYSLAQCLVALIYSVPQSLMVGAWIMLLPFALGFVYVWIRGDWHRRFMIWYVTLAFVPLLFLCCLDWVLYGFWGFRLDATPFIYILDDPVEAARESPWWAFPLTTMLIAGLGWLVWQGMRLVYPQRRSGSITRMSTGSAQQREGVCNLLLAIVMGIIGSGCWGWMGIASAYHTDQQPLNHAATSPIYSFFHAVQQQRQPLRQQYRFMSDEECADAMATLSHMAQLHADELRSDSAAAPLLQQQAELLPSLIAPAPNVLIVLFESFSGTACHYLNAEADPTIMPAVNQAMAEGIAFTQCYANSFRTERGLVSVLSAFPGQPTHTLMPDSLRLAHLTHLTQPFGQAGYSLEYVHGGDGQFCGLPAYQRLAGFQQVSSRLSFPADSHDGPWGMQDGPMFDYLLDRLHSLDTTYLEADSAAIPQPTAPFLKVMMTLSSHEPFEVPFGRFADPYLNSVAYADSCFGSFMDQLRADTLLWNHLLVIGLPDHCYADYPHGIQQHDPERYHIPMFWTGGAVRQHLDVTTFCQQTDLAATLLHRLGLSYAPEAFPYSHDVFDAEAPHFAFYAWPDGFGFLTDSCSYIQDNYYDGHPLPGSDDPSGHAQRLGKAYLQTIYNHLSEL